MRPRLLRAAAAVSLAAALLLPSTIGAPPAVRADSHEPNNFRAPALPRPTTGYWMVGGDGGVFAFGDAGFYGSTGGMTLRAPVVGMAATPAGAGYWMVARDGGIFAFGDAPFLGSTGAMTLNQPIVGMAPTPSGDGYWLVARDGGIFSFGDAEFFGSTGAMALNKPIVGMAATPTGEGYWLVASDGGLFTFGDAEFFGSTGSMKLNAPIVAMAPTSSGDGYWMVATDGGIFTFGDAAFRGSTGSMKLNKPIVGMTVTGFGGGYWLVASDGGVFSFGDAGFFGSTGSLQLASPIVSMAPRPKPGPVTSAVFYYPWYGTPDANDRWRHWDDPTVDAEPGPFAPPDLIASNFYPRFGPYSSSDAAVLDGHMVSIAEAGINTVVVSWWGRGSYEDARLGAVAAAARARGLAVAAHVEPYEGRTVESVARDVEHLVAQHGISEVWLYLSDGPAPESWRLVTDSFPGVRVWGHSHRAANATTSLFASYAAAAGFDGVYTYDPLPYSPASFERVCAQARARGLLCSPSVNPGYDDTRIRPDSGETRSRDDGRRFNAFWRGAFAAGPDVVSITSYNEWHEGTQIEPAASHCVQASGCYDTYEGAFGATGGDAAVAYLLATRRWTDALAAASG